MPSRMSLHRPRRQEIDVVRIVRFQAICSIGGLLFVMSGRLLCNASAGRDIRDLRGNLLFLNLRRMVLTA